MGFEEYDGVIMGMGVFRIVFMFVGDFFYIIMFIYYFFDVLYIGYGYMMVVVDMFVCWYCQGGDDMWMFMGIDEYGQKMLCVVVVNGVMLQEWVDKFVSESWFLLLKMFDVVNDDFICMMQECYEMNVQMFFQWFYDCGYIYVGEYEVFYCVGCEEFKFEFEIVDGMGFFEGLKVCVIYLKLLELLQEKNYFFKFSEFQELLFELYRIQFDFVCFDLVCNEVVLFVSQGFKDLLILWLMFDWGILLFWDELYVIYVWVDVLFNYVMVVGYGFDEEIFVWCWFVYYVVGKDILCFYVVIWFVLLMVVGFDVLKGVFVYGWLFVGGEKMLKLKFIGIVLIEIIDVFGLDVYCFYFLLVIVFGQDGLFFWEDLFVCYQVEFVNGFGNFVLCMIVMIEKYFEGIVFFVVDYIEKDFVIQRIVVDVVKNVDVVIEQFCIDEVILVIWIIVDVFNGYIMENELWVLVCDEDQCECLGMVLYICVEGLCVFVVLLLLVMFELIEKFWIVFGVVEMFGCLQDQFICEVGFWGVLEFGISVNGFVLLFFWVEFVV